jgi:hypothetical protein
MSEATGEYDTYIDIAADRGTYGSDTFGTAADTILQNLEQQILAIRDYSSPAPVPAEPTPPPALILDVPAGEAEMSPADRFAAQVAPLYPADGLTDVPGPPGGAGAQPSRPPAFSLAQEPRQDSSALALLPEPIISSRPNNDDPAVARAAEIGQKIGLSIRLNYLGSINQITAPQVVKSWIADKDLASLAGGEGQTAKEVPTVEVAVLLTKNQLSSLSGQLKIIMEEADKALDSQSRDFFQSILSASAQVANDPQAFQLKPETKLGDLGVMGEFLEDLPYKSVIMGKTEQDWYNMSYIEQDNFIRVIKSKVLLYGSYDVDTENWAKFDSTNSGDWLYRVPLTALP